MQNVHTEYLIIRNTRVGEWEGVDGCMKNVCQCDKTFTTVNWKACNHGDGDGVGRERRERMTP